MTDLVTLARDEAQEARVVLLRQWNRYVERDLWQAHILHGDRLWMGCMHGHQTEEVAAKCALRPRAGTGARWIRGRAADEITVVSPGVIEWRWFGPRPGRVTYGRDCPAAPPDHTLLVDLGPVKP